MLAACTALVSGGGTTSQRIFKHDPPPELVDRLAAAAGACFCGREQLGQQEDAGPRRWHRPTQHAPTFERASLPAAPTGSLSLLPHGASPHALAGLLKRFLLGLPEPLLTYRLVQDSATSDEPAL